jgi:hypothetical protein
MAKSLRSENADERTGMVDDREAREMALFLVRVFGEEAPDVAAERAGKSDQAEEWRRVGVEIERLLSAAPIDELDRRPLRPFR